jgi:hypothetical protein
MVKHFLDERGDEHVLLPCRQGGQGLSSPKDIHTDAVGEVAVDYAGVDKHVRHGFAAVFAHLVGVGTGHLLVLSRFGFARLTV